MADTKLILRIDNLAHKLISAESEVAFGETFDILFEGLEDWQGKNAVISLYDMGETQVLWHISSAIQEIDGYPCLQNCVINTQEALDILSWSAVNTVLDLHLQGSDSLTYYGDTKLRLHPGKAEGGEPYTEIVPSIEQHNEDPTAHADIRQAVETIGTQTIAEVNTIIANHGASEEAARNQAIANAMTTVEANILSQVDTNLATQVQAAQAAADEAEGYAQSALSHKSAAEGSATEAAGSATSAASSAESAQNCLNAVTDIAATVASQADVCATAQADVLAKTINVQENATQVASDATAVAQAKGVVLASATNVEQIASGFTADVESIIVQVETAGNNAVTEINQERASAVELVTGAKTDAIEAIQVELEKIQNIEDLVDGFDETVQSGVNEINSAKNAGVTAVNDAKTSAVGEVDAAKTTGVQAVDDAAVGAKAELDGAVADAETALQGKVDKAAQSIEQSTATATTAATEAGNSATAAATSASNASTSATAASNSATAAQTAAGNAATSAAEAEAAAAEIAGVAGLAEAALPMALGEDADYKQKYFKPNVLRTTIVVPFTNGFIFNQDTLSSPYAGRAISWLKTNGEFVRLGANDANHPWMRYQASIRAGWFDGTSVCFAVVYSGINYKVTLPIVDGTPSYDTMSYTTVEAGAGISVTQTSKYVDGFVVNEHGQIFNPTTLEVTATVSLRLMRLITPASGGGVRVVVAEGVALLNVDENGAPILTTLIGDDYAVPLASRYAVASASFRLGNSGFQVLFSSGGSFSYNTRRSQNGNSVPAYSRADIGDFIVNNYGLFRPWAGGTTGNAVGVNIPVVRFLKPFIPSLADVYDTSLAFMCGEAILVIPYYMSLEYLLLTKEELV